MTDSYIGVPPQSGFISQEANQYFTGLTQNYIDLNQSISSLSSVIILVNGVVQENSTMSLTSSTRITLGDTLVSADKVTCIYVAKISSTQAPATGSVTSDMLSGSIANSKLANSSITLNGSAVSLGGSASVDNTPSFLVNISSAQSIPTVSVTKIQFDTEVFDTDSAFNTGSYRFTPQVAGKYVIGIHVSLNSSDDFDQNFIQINKNGSNVFQSYYENKYYNGHSGETVIVFNGSTDYVDFYIHQSRGGATDLRPDAFCTFAYGYKLIGV
jgi:hypothetical protein